MFVNIIEIVATQKAQAEQERQKAGKQARIDYKKLEEAAEITAMEMRARDFRSCQLEWQIDDDLIN